MQIFSLISRKGGAGKSTLARQLAVLAGETGVSVLIDRDPQETSTKWWQRRQSLHPLPKQPDLLDLGDLDLMATTRALRDKNGVVFVDTRPAVAEPEAEAARVADLIIVPVRPSSDDLEAIGETLKILHRLRETCCCDCQCGQKRDAGTRRPCRIVALPGSGLSNACRRPCRLF